MKITQCVTFYRRLINHVVELGEYIELLQVERQHLEHKVIEQDEAPHLESKPDKPEICGLTTRAVDMYTDRNSLMQDIITKENTLYATKQAYESLKKDLSRLQKEKDELRRKVFRDQSRLAASNERLKAFQALRHKQGKPKDTWEVCSLPNLYCTKFPTKAKHRKF